MFDLNSQPSRPMTQLASLSQPADQNLATLENPTISQSTKDFLEIEKSLSDFEKIAFKDTQQQAQATLPQSAFGSHKKAAS